VENILAVRSRSCCKIFEELNGLALPFWHSSDFCLEQNRKQKQQKKKKKKKGKGKKKKEKKRGRKALTSIHLISFLIFRPVEHHISQVHILATVVFAAGDFTKLEI